MLRFFGIGTYTAALLVLPAGHLSGSGSAARTRLGAEFGPALVAAVGVAFVFAALISVPARRVQGEYLILLTIAFQIIVNQLMISWTGLTGRSVWARANSAADDRWERVH